MNTVGGGEITFPSSSTRGTKKSLCGCKLYNKKIPGTAIVCVTQEGSLTMVKKVYFASKISLVEGFIGMVVLANLLQSR